LADDRRLALLRAWQDERLTGGASFRPAVHAPAARWAIVVLLRATAETEPPAIDLRDNGDALGRLILENVQRIEGEEDTWGSAVTGDLHAKADQLRAAITTAREAAAARAAHVLAETDINPERVASYRGQQREAFDRRARLRATLEEAEALTIEPGAAPADVAPSFGRIDRKELFVGDDDPVVIDPDPPGQQAALDQQRVIIEAISQAAESIDAEDALDGAARAIVQMRAAGFAPDAVLTPNRARFRPTLAANPDFRWSRRDPRERTELGYLRDVPVLDVLLLESDYLLVVNFTGALHVMEHREPGQTSSLRVDVNPIDADRATALIDAGRFGEGEGEEAREELVRALVESHVEINFGVDYRVTVEETAHAAARRFRV
jgi:hypothetical protein